MASTWNDIRSGLNGLAKKVDRRAERLTTCAAIRLKLSAARADLEEEYANLGKLTYQQTYSTIETIVLDGQEENELSLDEQIATCVSHIAALNEQIVALEAKAKKYGCK